MLEYIYFSLSMQLNNDWYINDLMYLNFLSFYYRNVSVSVNECYTKPLRAAKLKDSISDTLLLFLYTYRELSEVSSVLVHSVTLHLYNFPFTLYFTICIYF